MKKPVQIARFHTFVCGLLIALAGCSMPVRAARAPGTKLLDAPEMIKANEAGSAGSDAEGLSENLALGAETPMLTVGATPVYWSEFRFWLYYIEKYYKKHRNLDAITDWNVRQNGMPLSDFFLTTAADYACKDRAIATQAKVLGIKLSENILASSEECLCPRRY